jgi:hypothetical protein
MRGTTKVVLEGVKGVREGSPYSYIYSKEGKEEER